jgi:prophage antirepressor-like protein
MPITVIELLNDPGHGLTVLGEDEPLILAAGLAEKLGYPKTDRLLALVKPDEQGQIEVRTRGGRQTAYYVTLPGMLRAMGTRPASRIPDPEVRATVEWFQDWIYREILPELVRTGGQRYISPEAKTEVARLGRWTEQMVGDLEKVLEQHAGNVRGWRGALDSLRQNVVAEHFEAFAGPKAWRAAQVRNARQQVRS